jgi:hypothetical protein
MGLDDTHPDVRRAQFARLREMTETERLGMAAQLTCMTVHLSRQAIRETMPDASEQQVILRWIELTYGKDLARRVAPFAQLLGRAPLP